MEHNVSASIAAELSGKGLVLLVRVGDANREVVTATRVEAVHEIKPFGGFPISLELLVTNRLIAQTKIIRFQHRLSVEQVHSALSLLDHHLCDRRAEVALELRNVTWAVGRSRPPTSGKSGNQSQGKVATIQIGHRGRFQRKSGNYAAG